MSFFSDIGNSFKKVFTNPGKANIGQIATVVGLTGAAAEGVAAYGASRTSGSGTVSGGYKVYDSGARVPLGSAPGFGTYLKAGLSGLATNTADVLKATGATVYGGVKAASGGLYSGGGTVLSSVLHAPAEIAKFLGQALPAYLAASSRQPTLASSAGQVVSGASRWFDGLNGARPGTAPPEASITTFGLPSPSSPSGSSSSPAGDPGTVLAGVGSSPLMTVVLIGAAVTALVYFSGVKKK